MRRMSDSADAEHDRRHWECVAGDYQRDHAQSIGGSLAEAWGVWRIPESELEVLGDIAGRDVLELGCGAAQWPMQEIWRARKP